MKLSLSPSAASRWLVCQASPRFISENENKLPKDTSVWAEEGGIAHEYAAASILMGWDDGIFKADHADMVEPVKTWHDYVRAHILSENDTVLVEQKLPLFYYPERNGITDLAIVNRNEDLRPTRLVILDYKHGVGVTVEAVGNPQLVIYAVNVMRNLPETLSGDVHVKLGIVQPRCREGDVAKVWELTVDELRNEAEAIESCAKNILLDAATGEPALPFVQSDKTCQFCNAQAVCPTFAKAALAEVPEAMTTFELPSVEALSIEQLGKIQASASTLTKYLGAVKEHLLNLGLQAKLPESSGFKVVQGKSNRQWSDEAEAQRLLVNALRTSNPDLSIHELRDMAAPRSVVSPSAADALLKPIKADLSTRSLNMIQKLMVKPEGSPTLAPIGDKRPALNPVSDFVDESLL